MEIIIFCTFITKFGPFDYESANLHVCYISYIRGRNHKLYTFSGLLFPVNKNSSRSTADSTKPIAFIFLYNFPSQKFYITYDLDI